jgi:ornithine cyclodeaminase/alanine dehydrogenase-like protein (mu-crystallin family)
VGAELRLIGAEELRARLPMVAAIDALDKAFRTLDPGTGPLRTSLETPAGSLLVMPAFGEAGVGVKLVTLTSTNRGRGLPSVQAGYVLFDAETQSPEAVFDGTALTALRTAAVSGLATRHLAREDAVRLVMFGAGVQARAHLEAICAVRPVSELVVISRSRGPAGSLVAAGLDRGLAARLGDPGSVAEADLICTCTTSQEPLFDGSLLRPGVHVNAVGSHRPDARELDTETVRRGRIVVETRDVALAEAGELAIPIADGAIEAEHVVADLAEACRGAKVRRTAEDLTVFKCVGMAFEDLVVARAIVDAPPA